MEELELFQELEPIIRGFDLVLVDLRVQQLKGSAAVQLVIYRQSGIGTEDCASVHRAIGPRLEIIYENRDIRLEVTSPGLDRKIRLPREYGVFIGRGIVLHMRTGHEHRGIIENISENELIIKNKTGLVHLALIDITKGKLDIFEEGKKWE